MFRVLLVLLVALTGCRSAPIAPSESLGDNRCAEKLQDGGPLEFYTPQDGGTPIRLTGELAQHKILDVLKSHRADFRACLDAALAQHTRPSGKLRVEFLIATDGTVSSSERTEATFDNENLAACVEEVVRALTFPRPDCGGPVLYAHTFVFMLESEVAGVDARQK